MGDLAVYFASFVQIIVNTTLFDAGTELLEMAGKTYSVYGLNVTSLLPLPELPAGAGKPDVTIRYGSVPVVLPGTAKKGGFFQAAPGSFLLFVDGVARYLVTGGRRIVIEREQGATDNEVRLFLLGYAFAPLLHQRGLLPLHCSAIAVGGDCVAFAGPSGTGKSTIAGAFLKRGYRILTDDICVTAFDSDGMCLAYPGYPQLKLWMDTVNELGEDRQSLTRISPGIDKFRRAIREEFYGKPLPLRRLYILGVSDTRRIDLAPLTGARKIAAIVGSTYHLGFLEGLGKQSEHFRQCNDVARSLDVIKVSRPREPFLLNGLVNVLEDDFSR